MQKKTNNVKFDFYNVDDFAELQQELIDIEIKFPKVIKFLEEYCGYNTAVLSSEPHEICYAQGKRDVILTLKTLMRKDIDVAQIVRHYNKL
jgi:hypothetical protein